jgi:hypothetical protein
LIGWTSACSPQSPYVSTLFGPTITAAQCCPSYAPFSPFPPLCHRTQAYQLLLSSFTCLITSNAQDIAFCTSFPPNRPISVLAVSGPSTTGTSSLTSVSAALSESWIYSNFEGQVIQAKPIFVAYQSTDTEILYLLTPTLRPTSPTPTTSNPAAPSQQGGLSESAKIAIAAIIPVVCIALIVATSLLCIHRRRKARTSAPSATVISQPKSELSAPSGYAGETRAELEGSRLPIQEVR